MLPCSTPKATWQKHPHQTPEACQMPAPKTVSAGVSWQWLWMSCCCWAAPSASSPGTPPGPPSAAAAGTWPPAQILHHSSIVNSSATHAHMHVLLSPCVMDHLWVHLQLWQQEHGCHAKHCTTTALSTALPPILASSSNPLFKLHFASNIANGMFG